MIPRAAIDISGALAHLAGRYDVLVAAVDGALARGAQEVARTARRNAPKLFSTLTNSIRVDRLGEMHYRVVAGMNYSRAVEKGTGPAAGRKRYYPNPDSLRQYLTVSPRMRGHEWARSGSAKRGMQELDIWFRSRALAWYIYNHGTRPQPFMLPALEENENRIRALVKGAIAQINREPGRG